MSYRAIFFGSRIARPVTVDRSSYVLRNLTEPTTNTGVELLGLLRSITAGHHRHATATFARVSTVADVTRDVELTPRHSIGLVAMLEDEDARRRL